MMASAKQIAAAAFLAFLALPRIQASPCKPSSLTTLPIITETSSPSPTTTTAEITTFTTESSTSVLTVSTSIATTTSISDPPFECRPSDTEGCNIDNYAYFCCTQCCFFPEGDITKGQCC